jgi:hypothetical protein
VEEKMKKVFLLLLLATPAWAQEPTEEVKTWALKRAYELNGNSMVGWGSIDLTDEIMKRKVKTERIIPDMSAEEYNELDAAANERVLLPPRHKTKDGATLAVVEYGTVDVCTRHHLRKVMEGKSWHCRK